MNHECFACLRKFGSALALSMHTCSGSRATLAPGPGNTIKCVECGWFGPSNHIHDCPGVNPLTGNRGRPKKVTTADGKVHTVYERNNFGCTDCLKEFDTYQDFKDHRMIVHHDQNNVPTKLERPNPNSLGPSTTTDANAALTMAIWATRATLTTQLENARDFANEVNHLLRRMGFTIELVTGKATAEVREAEYDFTDFCTECERVTEEQKAWDDEDPPYRMGERPDRFCLFHRGYVSGAIAEHER